MVRTIVIVAATALVAAGVGAALSRADVADPGPPIMLSSPATNGFPANDHDVDGDHDPHAADDGVAVGDRDEDDDDFAVVPSRPVQAHDHDTDTEDPDNDADDSSDEDDWDADDGLED